MRKPFRITTWQGKLTYVVAGWLVTVAVNRVIATVDGYSVTSEIIATVLAVSLFLVGARLFRGANELRDPPRPWWRMTAGAKLSRRLGILFIVMFGLMTFGAPSLLIPRAPGRPPVTPLDVFSAIMSVLMYATLAVFYVTSGRRLRRLEGPAPKHPTAPPGLAVRYDEGDWPRAR